MLRKHPYPEKERSQITLFFKENLWLLILLALGAIGGLLIGYYVRGYSGLFAVAIGSLTGFIGHLIDSRE
ncbi:MAG: hypothetical protein ACOCQX_04985 [Candidatus Nanoarchaeia archaeon]